MIRSIFCTHLARAHGQLLHSISRRLYNSTNSVFKQNQEHFDLSDDLLDATKDPYAKKKRKRTYAEPSLSHKSNPRSLSHKFKHCLNVTDADATKIINQNKFLLELSLTKVSDQIEFLFEKKISAKSIKENIWLLSVDQKYLEEKLALVHKLNPRDINDFLPLVRVAPLVLVLTEKSIQREKQFVPEGNRIYYFAKRLKVEPSLVAKYFSTHMFMMEIDFDMLVENLNTFIEYKVSSISMLRDLWAFKYYPRSIRIRLDRCYRAGKLDLKPWMVRCPVSVLERTLTLSQEHFELMGDKTIYDYLAERLGYNLEMTKGIVARHPALLKVRATRIKEVLDYLLIEEKFEPYEIANCIRILCHKVDTTRKRIDQLKALGCRPSTLVIVCRSQIEYNKFVDTWIENRKRSEQKKEEANNLSSAQ